MAGRGSLAGRPAAYGNANDSCSRWRPRSMTVCS
ncbi:phosphoenolpyruvate hydrolase family protein [Kribbella caucasensis]|nr:phosphoenolpyruvate hydrolase family protein [Kribbella sp. VKM Ac-2527]